ncbi:MAG: hypothetical protein R3C49_10175 [Planctomycetaceae bacterium]
MKARSPVTVTPNKRLAVTWKPAVWLTVVLAVGWVVCFWPSRLLSEVEGVHWMTIACFCSLVPGWFVVLLGQFAIFRDEIRLMAFQTTVRFVSVFGVVLVVKWLRPDLGFALFYGWLILFYLLSLVTEVYFVGQQLKGRLKPSSSVPSSSPEES